VFECNILDLFDVLYDTQLCIEVDQPIQNPLACSRIVEPRSSVKYC